MNMIIIALLVLGFGLVIGNIVEIGNRLNKISKAIDRFNMYMDEME